ncbi:DUF475 domain-containing protein [Marinagarivorans algicola]|uniref:DUF475 domain-containing protein n=1 Tax=Marinagarivorans algicola TaxID=1513270 RepID=UPI0006B5B7D4|nr:DUF475 domain-containing protein [Marinagarivorans algicola]
MGNIKFFWGSFLVTAIGAAAAFYFYGLTGLFLVAVLSVLEISLSFDNAVVNATVLKEMDAVWRRRFLTWGILIAVFGMRIVFPVAVVSVIAMVSPWEALRIAIDNPEQYKIIMESAHISLMGFGGAFLMLVGLDFFLNDEKEEHWIGVIERPVLHVGKIKFAAEILTVLSLLVIGAFFLPEADKYSFLTAGVSGVITFTAIHKLANFMESKEEQRNAAKATQAAAKSGLGMFLYLEILDASFSFDGVIAAFAITTNLFIIAIGLGIGAMFVRSLTIMLVEKNTLDEYRYLEHGAFYAIIALAIIMFIKTFHHVPEVITGLLGAGFIAIAFAHSIIIKKRHENQHSSS